MTTVKFPAYRTYESLRVTVNDAMMAMLVGGRLASHTMSLHQGTRATLAEIFPAVHGVGRMNQRADDVRRILASAEQHFTFMGIPYVVGLHVAHLQNVAALLIRYALVHEESNLDPATLDAEKGHETLLGAATFALNLADDDLALFSLIRRIRNRILHGGGTPGSHLKEAYGELAVAAKERWERPAGRPLPIPRSNTVMHLGAEELVACLAITHQIARGINYSLQAGMPRSVWARIAAEDYRTVAPQKFHQQDRGKRLRGFARTHYGPLELHDVELEEAAETLLAEKQS